MVNDKTQNLSEPKHLAAMSGKKIERRLNRTTADTVSNWISEHRENNRVEEISAIGRMFGGESLLSKIAWAR